MKLRIRKILKDWKEEVGVTRVIQYRYRNGILTIYTSQPGLLIGKAGVTVDKYGKILKKEISNFENLEFVETEYYWV